MARVAAAAYQQLERVVEHARVGALLLEDGPVHAQRQGTGAHPVDVAANRVDLAVVAQEPERLRPLPRRLGVRREALVEDAERNLDGRVAQVGVERSELVGRAKRLVDDRAKRERCDVEIVRGRRGACGRGRQPPRWPRHRRAAARAAPARLSARRPGPTGRAPRGRPAPTASRARRSPRPGRLPRPRDVHPGRGGRPSRCRDRARARAPRAEAGARRRRRPCGDPPPRLPGGGHDSVPRGGSRARPVRGHRRAGRRNRCRRHRARRPKDQTWTNAPPAHLFGRRKEAPPGGTELAGEGGKAKPPASGRACARCR